MIPQDTFMVAAPIRTEAKASLYQLLGRMNLRPGVVDPANPLLPFQNFHTIHFARFVVLEDQTLSDLAAYHESFPNAPVYLVFLGDCDGPSAHLLQELAREAGPHGGTGLHHFDGDIGAPESVDEAGRVNQTKLIANVSLHDGSRRRRERHHRRRPQRGQVSAEQPVIRPKIVTPL